VQVACSRKNTSGSCHSSASGAKATNAKHGSAPTFTLPQNSAAVAARLAKKRLGFDPMMKRFQRHALLCPLSGTPAAAASLLSGTLLQRKSSDYMYTPSTLPGYPPSLAACGTAPTLARNQAKILPLRRPRPRPCQIPSQRGGLCLSALNLVAGLRPAARLDARRGMQRALQAAEGAVVCALRVQQRVPKSADDAVVALRATVLKRQKDSMRFALTWTAGAGQECEGQASLDSA